MVQQGQVFPLTRARRRGAMGVSLSDRWSRLAACAAWWLRDRAGRAWRRSSVRWSGCDANADLARRRRSPSSSTCTWPARRAAGDDREAALAAQLRRCAVFGDRRLGAAALAGDRRVADDDLARLPLRGNPGAPAGAPSGGRVGDDRRQPGQGRASTTRSGDGRRSIRSSRGRNSKRSPQRSGRATGR